MSGRKEAAMAIAAYGTYLAARQIVWTEAGRQRAHDNAKRLVESEARLGIDVEASVQRVAMRWPRLVDLANAGYAAGNVALSVGWLMSLHRRDDQDFRRERTAAMVAFVGAVPVFAALPMAPPRMLDGYVDTLAERGWNLDHPQLVRFYNPVAAMPSHHVAFAVVTGCGLASRARSPIGRVGWRAYPVAVAAIVIATGNHFVSDVVAGAALGVVARRVARGISR